ncbi:MAG: response regulator, partial [Spirochaetota bacterium]
NLFVNAWQAMPGGGDLFISSSHVTFESGHCPASDIAPGRYICLTVSDTGTGMDEKTLLRVFEPFFTTKEKGHGTGMGLASAYGIIRNHGGIITVFSEKGRGSSFTVYLPWSDKIPVPDSSCSPSVKKGNETILLVDDEKIILSVAGEMLSALGYHVIPAAGGAEACRLLEENLNLIDGIILDMIMPGMSGSETFDNLRKISSRVKILLSSGYSLSSEALAIMDKGCSGFIQKPFTLDDLSVKMQEFFCA